MNATVLTFTRFMGRKSPLPSPLRWVIERARRLQAFYGCTRREAITEAIADYHHLMGHPPSASPVLKGRSHA
jgi:hypothetical protein